MSVSSINPQQIRGFTLIELIIIMMLLGILAVTVMPRMNSSDFKAGTFRDEVASALRFAQKTATSHRRLVCASLAASSISLRIASANQPGSPATSCDTDLRLPAGKFSLDSGDASIAISAPPGTLYFQPDGKISTDGSGSSIYSADLSINGLSITVAGGTGHVQ